MKIIFFLILSSLYFSPLILFPQSAKASYLDGKNRNIISYNIGVSCPKKIEDVKSIRMPELSELRLKFPNASAGNFTGPDNGETYQWKNGLYKWTRSDGTVVNEWENGTVQLESPGKFKLLAFPPTCQNCLPNLNIEFKDGSSLNRFYSPDTKVFSYFVKKCAGKDFELTDRISYFKDPSRTELTKYSYPKTAPTDFQSYLNITEPNIDDLRLKISGNVAANFSGPDGGVVNFWKPGHYQWKRSDGSIFIEQENGSWHLNIPNQIKIDSYTQVCNGCLPSLTYTWPDGSQIHKSWIPHRKDYSVYYQNDTKKPALLWLIPDPNKFAKLRTTIGSYEFYHSASWNFFLEGLRDVFNQKAYFNELEREYGLSNEGKIPVLLFDKSAESMAYNGRELPGGSAEGGFGGQDSIQICCGEKQIQAPSDAVIAEDTKKRLYYGTFFHEATHNMHQIGCLTKRVGKQGLPLANQNDPWFVEGLANHVAANFTLSKQAEIYEQLNKRLLENKVPRDFDGMLKQSYNDLLPYYLGAYLVEYMHREYGKESVKTYLHATCLAEDTKSALKKATGKEANQFYLDALENFKTTYAKSSKNIREWKFGHLTKMNAKDPKAFEEFVTNGFAKPNNFRDYQSIEDVPDLNAIFEADVSKYSGLVEGDFNGQSGQGFYLWKKGNYKWYGDAYEVFINPGSSIMFRNKGWEFVQWANGQKKVTAPDGSNAMFWNKDQKGYFDKNGKPIQ
ncbi:MAG: hypothetical protein SH817_17240 [Leptospira sp.]|nr:hypothetical protein [Leptospira sp.]